MEVAAVIAMVVLFLWLMSKSDEYTDLDEKERREKEPPRDGEGD